LLRVILEKKKDAIVARWLALAVEAYAEQSRRFLLEGGDRFENPVGSSLRGGLGELFDCLLREEAIESASPFLDEIIKVRAVQEIPPSQACGFILRLKEAAREILGSAPEGGGLAAFESRVEALALLAFDRYVSFREKIFEIKANEVRKRTSILLERLERYGYGPRTKDSSPEESDQPPESPSTEPGHALPGRSTKE
jgi:hypothetical protein